MPLLDDNFNDYFEQPQEEKPAKEPQVETAEEREEREIKEATIERRYNRVKWAIGIFVTLAVLLAIFWCWQRYFHPYIEGEECGYVETVTNQGTLFKTYEGKMMTEKMLPDTVRRYYSDFLFTIRDDSVARNVMRAAGTGRRVRLSYEEYKGRLPWRGETPRVVTAIEYDTIR